MWNFDNGCNNNCSTGGFGQDYIWIIVILLVVVFAFGGLGGSNNNNCCSPNPCC